MKIISQKNIVHTTSKFRDHIKSNIVIISLLLATGCQTTTPALETTLPSETPMPINQIEVESNSTSLQEQQLKIDKLTQLVLQSVEKQIQALQLTQPAEYNAWDQLQRLESVVGTEQTTVLRHKIIETYLSLARENINPNSSADDLEQAKDHISMARQLYHLLPKADTSITERISQIDTDLKNQFAAVNALRSPPQQSSNNNEATAEDSSTETFVAPPSKKLLYEKALPSSDVVGRTDQARQVISYQANRIIEDNLRVVVTASSMSDYRWISAVLKSAVNSKKSDFQLQCEPLITSESAPSMKFFQ